VEWLRGNQSIYLPIWFKVLFCNGDSKIRIIFSLKLKRTL
ncbi:MAG: hypothetical protein ACI9FB_004615, partial [Candidatus Azotimanducaceae bacterium]